MLKNQLNDVVFIWDKDGFLKVNFSEIMWVEAARSYCVFHLSSGKKITLSVPLLEVSGYLPEKLFIRIHRSYIINLDFVTRISGNMFYLGDKSFLIAKTFRKEVAASFIFLGSKRRPVE
ncbi:MAG: LytTR family transcriptional regulator [Tannerellaceae bacterium]|nr:LytTR family transcriptional regulator [Tannerellaceae bacterium]